MQRTSLPRLAVASLVLLIAAACSNKTLPGTAAVRAARGEQAQTGVSGGDAIQGSATGDAQSSGGAGSGSAGSSSGAIAGRGGTSSATPGDGGVAGPAAPSGGSSVGVTPTSIKIAVSGVFSGVSGAIGNDIYDKAAVIWQKQVNANGGIHGRQITLVKVDNQGTADGAIAACKEVTSNGSFMVWNMEGAVGAEDDCENAAGIPILDANPPYMRPAWKNVMAINLSPSFVPAEVSFLKSHYMNAGGNKIGIVYASDKEGYVLWYDAMVAELKAQGMSLVHSEKIVSNQASYVSEMSRMKASGAQTVLLYVTADAPLIIGNAKAVGYAPQWYGGTAEGTVSDTFAQAAGAEFQGVFGTRFWTTTESPAYARYISIVRKYGGDAAAAGASGNDVGVYGHADTLGRMFELAGRDLTRQSFLTAAHTIVNYDNGYLVPFTLAGKSVSVGEAAVFPLKCCKSDSTWYSLGPPAERF